MGINFVREYWGKLKIKSGNIFKVFIIKGAIYGNHFTFMDGNLAEFLGIWE
jgi:hypothetical protein